MTTIMHHRTLYLAWTLRSIQIAHQTRHPHQRVSQIAHQLVSGALRILGVRVQHATILDILRIREERVVRLGS